MQALLPAALQAAQGMLTTALATLFLAALAGWPGGNTVNCALDATWNRWWRARDYQAIGAVQNALTCRGMNSPCDRAWPQADTTKKCQDHSDPCAPLWRAAALRDLSMALAVAVTIGVLQVRRSSCAFQYFQICIKLFQKCIVVSYCGA